MIYNKFVEIGRIAFISKGKDQQKLAVIVDVVDGNKVSILIAFLTPHFRFCSTDRHLELFAVFAT
jgi:hypothetical protein